MNNENNAAKQPVPDAGVREKIARRLDLFHQTYVSDEKNDGTYRLNLDEEETREFFDDLLAEMCALFPAPTPATSEDTRRLDELLATESIGITDGSATLPGFRVWALDRAAIDSCLKQRAMAHAGEQKT